MTEIPIVSPMVRIVSIWKGMKQRCLNPKLLSYRHYGGRGIKICDRWLIFENFLDDMGLPPPGCSLHRKNNDGNYEKANCKWATPLEQASNQRRRHGKGAIQFQQKREEFDREMNKERPIVGLDAIAKYLFLSLNTIKAYSSDWQRKGILIPRLIGSPPNRRRVIISYPDLLQRIRS